METYERVILDMITSNSVSILKQKFRLDDNGKEVQIGSNIRLAYVNNLYNRNRLQKELTEDNYNKLIAVWGQTSTEDLLDLKNNLIMQMSNECNQVITNGFDIQLSDGNTYHFSLKIEDQLMIQALMLKAKAGETTLPYHADGESCRYFTVDEINLLYSNMEKLITYNTTYFNSLRDYINSITDRDEIDTIEYGIEIPEEYQSEVLKSLLET